MAGPWEQYQAAPETDGPWKQFAKPDMLTDVAKSAGSGLAKGPINFAGAPGDARALASKATDYLGDTFGASPESVQGVKNAAFNVARHVPGLNVFAHGPTSDKIQEVVEGQTGKFYEPQTSAGHFSQALTSSLTNPLSYIGPGSIALKAGGATLGAVGSEAAGQATEGTAGEIPARLAGGLAGGITAAKTLGPTAAKASIPTAEELKAAAKKGYDNAGSSGLTLDPKGVGSWASGVEQDLNAAGFTGGKNGTASKTLGALADLQSPPGGATISSSNLDTIRKTLGNIAKETQPANGGAVKATPDAAAASKALEHLKNYTENIPQGHILAGDAAKYVRETAEANKNYAAYSRTRDFDARLTKAENATDRQVAGSLDSQIKSKAGQMLDNPSRTRGLTKEEIDQLQLVNSGDWKSNILRQLGRGGAGVIPIMGHAALAAGSGGATLPAQAAIAAALYGSRKGAEAMTKSRASKLAEMLAKRSPEYESRLQNLSPTDTSSNKAAIVRSLLMSQ